MLEPMHTMPRVYTSFLLTALVFGSGSAKVNAQPDLKTDKGGVQSTAEERDGQHDFDFQFGSWKVHNRRLLHPLTGSNDWVEFDGTVVARPVWGGLANMDEFEADSPSGPIRGMTIRTYNPKSHEWSIYWANQKNGVISLPPVVGKFKDGRGEFYDQEEFNGRTIFVRYLWLVPSVDTKTTRWEQAFSTDGGKTWETNWIIEGMRIKE